MAFHCSLVHYGWIFTARIRSMGKVMFSRTSVILSMFSPIPQEADPSSEGSPPGCGYCYEIRSTSGRYASYWNASLLYNETKYCIRDVTSNSSIFPCSSTVDHLRDQFGIHPHLLGASKIDSMMPFLNPHRKCRGGPKGLWKCRKNTGCKNIIQSFFCRY